MFFNINVTQELEIPKISTLKIEFSTNFEEKSTQHNIKGSHKNIQLACLLVYTIETLHFLKMYVSSKLSRNNVK